VTIQKDCADFLRQTYSNNSGGKLRAGHAHELTAAYFGYASAAALRSEAAYPLTALDEGEILIPNIPLMEQRMQQLDGLPSGLPDATELASNLSNFLVSTDRFSGETWHTDKLETYIEETFIPARSAEIEDDLTGEMAETNAYFDELYVEEVTLSPGNDDLIATVSGHLNGENDPDRPFSGDSIEFTTTVTFERVAGRTAYTRPKLSTSGAVDDKDYYDDAD